MARRAPRTWAEIGYLNAGIRTTFRGLTFAVRWAACTAALGREPASVDEFCEVLHEARRSAFRDQSAFRSAFPGEMTPTRMITDSGVLEAFQNLVKRLNDLDKVRGDMVTQAFTLGAASPRLA